MLEPFDSRAGETDQSVGDASNLGDWRGHVFPHAVRKQRNSGIMRLTLDKANAIISATLEEGRTRALKPLSVAVLDAGGHLIAFQRSDGSSTLRPQIACGKAGGALSLGVSSRKIQAMAADRPSFVASLGSSARTGSSRRRAA